MCCERSVITIELIESVGLKNVTVRALADHAGVNTAAVNYYFGSKAKLINAALRQTLQHMVGDITELSKTLASAPKEKLTRIFVYLLEGALRYPNITRSHVEQLFAGNEEVPSFAGELRPLYDSLTAVIASPTPLEEGAARRRALQAISSILLPGFFDGFFEGTLTTEDARARYVSDIVETALRT